MYYRMSFDVFQNLVLKLTPFLQFQCINHMIPQLKNKKIVANFFYRFTYGHSAIHMVDHFNVSASTILKYVDIVCDVIININKILSKYISNPTWN
jgi:hypothetical protein